MKTLDQIVTYRSQAIDGRDTSRLLEFVPEHMLPTMEVTLRPEYVGKHEAKPLTRDAVLDQMKNDVAFGFEKFIDGRGISTHCMTEVVRMWLWVLEDGGAPGQYLYGGELFQEAAEFYGFPIPDEYWGAGEDEE